MSLDCKPHSGTVLSAQEVEDTNSVVTGIDHEAGQTITGQLTPETFVSTYQNWGLDLKLPHLYLSDVEDSGKMKVGDIYRQGAREFEVMAGPRIWDADGSTSCAAWMLNEVVSEA